MVWLMVGGGGGGGVKEVFLIPELSVYKLSKELTGSNSGTFERQFYT